MDRQTRTQPGSLIVVNFHHVRARPDEEFPHLHGLTLEQFRGQLDALERTFEMVGPADLEASIRGGDSLPENACLLTFDDGLRDHYHTVLPELERRCLQAFFFVCTAPYADSILLSVHRAHLLSGKFGYPALREELLATAGELGCEPPGEEVKRRAPLQYRYDDAETAEVKYYLNFVLSSAQREAVLKRVFRGRLGDDREFIGRHYMSPDEIQELGEAGMTVGMHSHRHLPLAASPPQQMREDLETNAVWLLQFTRRWPRWISYPYGGPDAWSEGVMAAARALDVMGGFTMSRQINRTPLTPLAIGRLDTNDAPGGKKPVSLEGLECV